MSAPKAKGAAANGTRKPKSTPTSDGTKTPVGDVSPAGFGKPDKAVFDAEQEQLKKEIDAVQTKLSAVREKIGLVTKTGTGNDKRATLRAELDSLRGQQSNSKQSRGKIFDQMKTMQDAMQKKIKDLQSARNKTPYKTVAEVDARIAHLDKQVESGSMKLADEKRALQELTQTKRARKTVESFQAESDAIDADRAVIEDLKKQLDDPEAKAASDRYDTIKAELDELKKESDDVYASRNKLFDERNALQSQADSLFNQKRESAQRFREANDRYWNKVNEERARRAERARAQREAEEEEKKKALADRLREEASEPAYQVQIEDCQTLIDYFSGKTTTAPSSATLAKVGLADEPKLDIRTVEEVPQEGVVVRKKKDDEVDYFVGGKSKKGKKGTKGAAKTAPAADAPSSALNIPFPTLSALLALSIPPPVSTADTPRVIEDLKTKKAWYEANQARATADAIAKAEADIRRLTKDRSNVVPPNGTGETPPEPAPTPKDDDVPAATVPSEEVVEKLEEVNEEVAA
ncbi:hypothetical protein OF83DRAFT_1052364 [Amylostereum chailletii]|nr:hypothetical protein OF83DRAFT_1052364 [Amylostereum chailletii]